MAKQKTKSIKQWRIRCLDTEREEFYLIQDNSTKVALDQARKVSREFIEVSLFVPKPESGVHGQARKQLFPIKELEPQLQEILEEARLSSEEAWAFTEQVEAPTQGAMTCYPPLVENLSKAAAQINEEFLSTIKNHQEAEFNSAELFVTKEKERLYLSNGFSGENLVSKIYSEVCFSQTDPDTGISEEYLLTESGAHPEQLNFSELCENSSSGAGYSLVTEKPQSGEYSVLVGSEVLLQVLNDFVGQFDTANKYFGFPFFESGSAVINGFSGTPFTLWLDPQLDYAYGSKEYDNSGPLQKKIKLVENNKVVGNCNSQRMSEYNKQPVTTTLGNVCIEASGLPVAELRESAPKVIEILQFSGLFSDSRTLTFSSEIRLARLFDNESGQVKYLKGGSISGSFRDNFKKVKWSKETGVTNTDFGMMGGSSAYFGPKYALLSDVTLSS